MQGDLDEDNLFMLGKVMEIYAKDLFWEPVPVQGKFSMALLIQKEGVLMLDGPNSKDWSLKCLKLEAKRSKIFLLG